MHAIFCIECFSSSIFGAIFIPSLSQVKEVTPAARRRDARLSFAFVYPDKNGRFVVREVSSLCALCMRGYFFFFFFDSYMLNAQAISYRLPHLSKAYGDINPWLVQKHHFNVLWLQSCLSSFLDGYHQE
jgi:hypothetical protein